MIKIERDYLTTLGNSKTKRRGVAYWKRDFSLHYQINHWDKYNEIIHPEKYVPATTYTSMHDWNEFNRFTHWTKDEVIEYTVRLLRLYNEQQENNNEQDN